MSGLLSKSQDALHWLEKSIDPVIQSIMEKAGLSEFTTKAALIIFAFGSGVMLLKGLITSPQNMPPGPRPLPLIGNLTSFMSNPSIHEVFDELKQKYGALVTVKFGPTPTVVISDPELLKEAFIRQGKSASDRVYQVTFDIFTSGGKDIVGADFSPRLQIQRKIAHQALRQFIGAGSIDKYLSSAFQAMSAELDKTKQLVGSTMGFVVAYNILLSMCFGKTFSFDDPFFNELIEETKKLDEIFKDIGISDGYRIAKYFPNKGYDCFRAYISKFLEYLENVMAEHEKDFNPDKLTDFTYHLLKVMKDAEKNPDEKKELKLLTRHNYVYILLDLFFAGTDTTRMTLNWIWHYLAAFPEVQQKAQQEIDEVLGRDGTVSYDCRDKLPYIDAIIHEVLRIKPVAPMGVFHQTSDNIKLGGYDIPKGTGLICNTYSIHLDPQNWENPKAFLPERWMTDDGSYLYQQKGFVPFSMGRRSCIGESFAKLELHLLTTMLLQKYTLEPQPGYRVSVDAVPGMVVQPVSQQPIAVKRRI